MLFSVHFYPGMVLFGDVIFELILLRFGLFLWLLLPVLRIIVKAVRHNLPSKVKASLEQLYVHLKDCLWFIGSFIKEFIINPGIHAI